MNKKPDWILEENNYKDFEYSFPYMILHKSGDTEFFSGTLGSALAEFCCFEDFESFIYFIALLHYCRVLIPIDFSTDTPSELLPITSVKDICLKSETRDIDKNAKILPKLTKDDNQTTFLGLFTGIREIYWGPVYPSEEDIKNFENNLKLSSHTIPDKEKKILTEFLKNIEPAATQPFMYMEFNKVYEWIEKHQDKIDFIVFNAFDKNKYTYIFKTDLFLQFSKQYFDLFDKEYKNNKHLIDDLYQLSLNKHISKK